MTVSITVLQLQYLSPSASQRIVDGIVQNQAFIALGGIDTPLRLCHFITQLAHESAGFRTTREFGSGESYEGRRDLGNFQPGDGPRYRGRGLIQTIGRANYREVTKDIRNIDPSAPDFEVEPGALEQFPWALLVAVIYWKRRNINRYADRDDIKAITKSIQGGEAGLPRQEVYIEKAKSIWLNPTLSIGEHSISELGNIGDELSVEYPVLKKGDNSDEVIDLQTELRDAGYRVLTDGEFGRHTEEAVRDFQSQHGLVSDGVVDARTWAALKGGSPSRSHTEARISDLLKLRRTSTADPILALTLQREENDKLITDITDIVDVSAFAPESGIVGNEILVQIFLHKLRSAKAVEARARESDPRAARRGVATLAPAIARGTRVDILLEATGLPIKEPLQSVIWEGRPSACLFIVSIPAKTAVGPRAISARVQLNGVPIGRLGFSIEVLSTTNGTTPPIGVRGDVAQRYRNAFLSHARQDRAEVAKRAQALRAVGVDFFQDILSIEPGEKWEARLNHEIDTCDLFLLFWSSHAARSEWVMKEVKRAITRQKRSPGASIPDITPVILEGPPIPPPPCSLRHLHFNDFLRYFIFAAENESRASPISPR